MSDLIERLRSDFQDEEYRHSYAEECLNTMVATQIKVLREQRDMSQVELAEKTGMKQPRIPLLEDANYSSWTLSTLKRFARAFDLALTVRFDAFSDVVIDFQSMSKERLERPSFKDDPVFLFKKVRVFRSEQHAKNRREAELRALGVQQMSLWTGQTVQMPTPKESPAVSEKTQDITQSKAAHHIFEDKELANAASGGA